MKKITALIIILSAAAFIAYKIYTEVFTPSAVSSRSGNPVQAVGVEPVRKATLYHSAELTGSLKAEKEYIVASKVSGRLEKLYFDIGDRINRGETIAQLGDEENHQQVQMARADLEVARANLGESASELKVSEKELSRALSLAESGTLSQSELDQIQAAFDVNRARHEVAKAQVRQKEAALEAARVRLSYTRIIAGWDRSPDTRLVGRRFTDEGSMLQANEPIVSIVNTEKLIAVVNVIERDFPFIRVGQTAVVTADAYPEKTYRGEIVRFAPVLEEASRQARVEVLLSNPDGLLAPGMFARVRLEFSRREDVISVPEESIVRLQGRQGIFLADTESMKAEFVPVTVGLVDNGLAEIAEPRVDGLVITLGHHLLEDGMDITVPGLKNE
ncbi:MAG: efflux RND transporter periplasmic adaptor subunit [Desulfonatronovibrio sp.]